jgi:predicted metal-dependent peptidase
MIINEYVLHFIYNHIKSKTKNSSDRLKELRDLMDVC